MRGSTIVPWLFFGPLFTAVGSGLVYQLTRASLWAYVAMTAGLVALAVGAAAFLAARRPGTRTRRDT